MSLSKQIFLLILSITAVSCVGRGGYQKDSGGGYYSSQQATSESAYEYRY